MEKHVSDSNSGSITLSENEAHVEESPLDTEESVQYTKV